MKTNALFFVSGVILLVLTAACVPSTVVQVNTPVPNATTGTPAPNGQITVPGVSIQVYAAGLNPMVNTPDEHGAPANIWLGLWHGIISPVIIILSLLNKDVQMYEVHNDGSLYNLGFFLGVFLSAVIIGLFIGRR